MPRDNSGYRGQLTLYPPCGMEYRRRKEVSTEANAMESSADIKNLKAKDLESLQQLVHNQDGTFANEFLMKGRANHQLKPDRKIDKSKKEAVPSMTQVELADKVPKLHSMWEKAMATLGQQVTQSLRRSEASMMHVVEHGIEMCKL